MALNSSFTLAAIANLVTSLDLADASVPLSKTYKAAMGSGVAAGQADLVFHDTRTVAPSSNDDIDLAGVLAGLLGGTLTFARIKGLIIAAAAANVNNVVVGAAAGAPWITLLNSTGTVQVRPGAVLAAFAGEADATGWAVTATTADLLRVANGGAGTSVNYDIIVVGASA